MDVTLKPHKAEQSTHTPPRTDEEWESWKALIISWHHEGLSRQQICCLLFEHGFTINNSQLIEKITEWKLTPPGEANQLSLASVSNRIDDAILTPANVLVTDGVANNTSDSNELASRKPTLPMNNSTAFDTVKEPKSLISRDDTCRTDRRNDSQSPKPDCAYYAQNTTNCTRQSFSKPATHSKSEHIARTQQRILLPTESFLLDDDVPESECPEGAPETPVDTSEVSSESINTYAVSDFDDTQVQACMLQKMEAAEMGFPEFGCCCGGFFNAEKNFARFKPLDQMLMDQTGSENSLHHVRALARLCRGSVLSDAMTSELQHALQYYTKLLARPKIRNDVVYALALELAGIYDGIPNKDEEDEVRAAKQIAMEFFEDQDDVYPSTLKTLRDKYSHLYEGLRKLPINLKSSDNPSDWIDLRDEHRQSLEAQLFQSTYGGLFHTTTHDCREVILQSQNLVDVAQYASKLQPWSYRKGHIHARMAFERKNTIKVARKISSVLMSKVQTIAWPVGVQRNTALVCLVFDAIGLIVAQQFQEHGRLCGLPNDDMPTRLVAAANVLNIENTHTADNSIATSNMNKRILQAMWICDSARPLLAPQGLHIGPCKAKKCWDLLSKSVEEFDRTTSLVAPTALRYSLQPQDMDNVSMSNSSRKSNFPRFRKLSDKLKHNNNPVAAEGALPKWSRRVSVDSFTH
ncbi:hypothetical protein H2198_009173 [Neophaeococcomyces mojaviensis]|uniref:Uncharacterized protein n=1 Tax=Neophaeococcomyces mojaviensis TaxID=3383035 RepID=A0ACC2ZV62_9EURO|nr:hypothetical protein H2198_009173 [Knufia sp. JES_112]